ncbi:MAG: hypothetical protein Q9211_006392 [Gyalolechia sp. 1 TL-2023]
MAAGMPTWVTRTFEFLTHPRVSSIRSTLEPSHESGRLRPARRKSPARVGVGAERRKHKSRHSGSQLHTSRFPVKVPNSQIQETSRTDKQEATYENRSTQTDEAVFVPDGSTNLKEGPRNPPSPNLNQQGDHSLLWNSGLVPTLHPEKPYHNDACVPESHEKLGDFDGSHIPHHRPDGGVADQHIDFGETTTPDEILDGQETGTAAQDVEMSDGPPYTDGQAQVVLANDGLKDCLAILLTAEMVAKVSQIATRSRRLQFLTKRLKQVQREIASEENMLEYKNDALQDTDDQAEMARIDKEIDKIQQRIAEARIRIDPLEEEIDTLTVNLAYCREQSQEVFEEALGRMDLLNVLEPGLAQEFDPAGELDYNTRPDSAQERIQTTWSDRGNEIPISVTLDNVERQAAKDDLEYKRNVLITMDEAFEHRQENLAEEKAEYRRRVREGNCHITQTEFDLLALEDFRKMTADLRDAQEAFEDSFKRAKQLGVLDERDAHYQESVFSEWSGGYPLSMEIAMKGSAPTKSITYWQEGVDLNPDEIRWGGTELEPWSDPDVKPEATKMEDCDLQSVAISDSWSCIDWSRNRRRIDQWREIAGRER